MSTTSSLVVPPAWAGAVASAREARVILALGESDTGKTTLLTYLAGALLDSGRSVAVVDADLGQSEIGPPTTIGLGRLRRPLGRLGEAEIVGLYFVGATSPAAHVVPTAVGTGLLTARARRLGVDHVLVDTSGLVQGEIGRRLKRRKIDLVAADLVICLERDGECEHILRAYKRGRPAVLRLSPAPDARRRSSEERRRRREQVLAAYFAGARLVTLDLERVALREPVRHVGVRRRPALEPTAPLDDRVVWRERLGPELAREPWHVGGDGPQGGSSTCPVATPPVTLLAGGLPRALAGLDDVDRETVGLGLIRGLDLAMRTMTVETPVPAAVIAGVRLGRQTVA